MIGLNGTLSIASQSLSADAGALSVVNNNVANVNTSGYSRQLVNLSAEALSADDGSQANGVAYNGFSSVRDEVLQIGINNKTSENSSLTAQADLWTQIQAGFSSTTTGLGASLSNLFSSLSGLSTNPADAASRQAAMSAAGQLVDAFHQASATLSDANRQANGTVSSTVAEINNITSNIAALNTQLAPLQSAGKDGGSLADQRDALTTQLAGLVGISSTSTESTPSLSTTNGSPLVIGSTAYALQVTQGTDGNVHILDSTGQDITASLTGGTLGGALSTRDTSIPDLQTTLDSFATDFANAMNGAQTSGFDASGGAGQALFQLPVSGSAAAGITLASADPSSLALSSDGSAGSSGNLSNLLAAQTQPLASGLNATSTYASFVESIGDASSKIVSSSTATQAAMSQLTAQQSSESGVSLDEETANLLRYQQAYAAAAKVISTINDLYSTIMNMSS